MLSDEWAVTRTGRPLSLAGCLAEVAGWSAARRCRPCPAWPTGRRTWPSASAACSTALAPENPARRIWLGAAMVVLLIAVAAAAPAVSAARRGGRKRSAKPEVERRPGHPDRLRDGRSGRAGRSRRVRSPMPKKATWRSIVDVDVDRHRHRYRPGHRHRLRLRGPGSGPSTSTPSSTAPLALAALDVRPGPPWTFDSKGYPKTTLSTEEEQAPS